MTALVIVALHGLEDITNADGSAEILTSPTPKIPIDWPDVVAGITFGFKEVTTNTLKLPALTYGREVFHRTHSWYIPGVALVAFTVTVIDTEEFQTLDVVIVVAFGVEQDNAMTNEADPDGSATQLKVTFCPEATGIIVGVYDTTLGTNNIVVPTATNEPAAT